MSIINVRIEYLNKPKREDIAADIKSEKKGYITRKIGKCIEEYELDADNKNYKLRIGEELKSILNRYKHIKSVTFYVG